MGLHTFLRQYRDLAEKEMPYFTKVFGFKPF